MNPLTGPQACVRSTLPYTSTPPTPHQCPDLHDLAFGSPWVHIRPPAGPALLPLHRHHVSRFARRRMLQGGRAQCGVCAEAVAGGIGRQVLNKWFEQGAQRLIQVRHSRGCLLTTRKVAINLCNVGRRQSSWLRDWTKQRGSVLATARKAALVLCVLSTCRCRQPARWQKLCAHRQPDLAWRCHTSEAAT